MVFCNFLGTNSKTGESVVTILILVDGFLQSGENVVNCSFTTVTILILVDGFLQYNIINWLHLKSLSHNPYFSRWFSAIQTIY